MLDYAFTNEETVSRIADVVPRAMPAYFICLHNADRMGFASFTREFIIHKAIKSWTKFKNDIRALAGLYILNFSDLGDVIDIQIIEGEWNDRDML